MSFRSCRSFANCFPTSTHHLRSSRSLRPRLRAGRVLPNPTVAAVRTSCLSSTSGKVAVTSGFSSTYIVVAVGISIATYIVWPVSKESPHPDPELEAENIAMAQGKPLEGHIGNLTEEQEAKLRELWHVLFAVGGLMPAGVAPPDSEAYRDASHNASQSRTTSISDAASTTPNKKKKRFSVFRRGGDDDGAAADEDKHGQMQEYKQALKDQTPEQLRRTIWSFVKLDNPDALLLRFLRARKWDVQKALVMLVSTTHWRGQIVHLDDDLTIKGEEWFATQDKTGTGHDKQLGHDFMAQIRMGKSFIHGCDNEGRPLVFVRVKLHHGGEQIEESLEKYTIYTIETARLMLKNGAETATIVFDMTDFSMANMDYTPVKFMIKCFEANYPECLGAVCVFKSPWIFGTIWNIIKGWLDPVVASKVHFTKDANELSQYIPIDRIPKDLGGQEDYEFSFIEPVEGENRLLHEEGNEERNRLQAERTKMVDEYEAETIAWIRSQGKDDKEIREKRATIAEQLRKNYWQLDPYLRARTLYDRAGVLQPGGIVDFYPSKETAAAAESNGTSKGTTSGLGLGAARPTSNYLGNPRQSVDGSTSAHRPCKRKSHRHEYKVFDSSIYAVPHRAFFPIIIRKVPTIVRRKESQEDTHTHAMNASVPTIPSCVASLVSSTPPPPRRKPTAPRRSPPTSKPAPSSSTTIAKPTSSTSETTASPAPTSVTEAAASTTTAAAHRAAARCTACALRLGTGGCLWFGQEALEREEFVAADVELVASLEGGGDNAFLGLDGEEGLVDGAEDLVDFADLCLGRGLR
ncbi:hypothetical protein FH972_025524 [Carpinus fangiana]|uniref:CRAL-TRIO domain-containing protein n=1 Tax=Carpinus fangiana TaxID=176857 RepID=A0A5N6L1P6_9ROSI|nr:hypothetical protein FH972_025524 [Carpinus fangiana]